MKKYITPIAVSLLISLFIYVFYRTEKTLVNQLLIALFSKETYTNFRVVIASLIPLKDCVIYSLPEGLWVFCITITSGFYYIRIKERKWSLAFIPLLVAIVMEVLQLLHILNGRFDMMDILFSAFFWLIALAYIRRDYSKISFFGSFDRKAIYCIISYSIVYLAHVIRV